MENLTTQQTAATSDIGYKIASFLGIQGEDADNYKCICPCHNDVTPSLSIKKGDKIATHCFANCSWDSLKQYLIENGFDGFVSEDHSKSDEDKIVEHYCLSYADFQKMEIKQPDYEIYFSEKNIKLPALSYPYVRKDQTTKTKFKSIKRIDKKRLTQGSKATNFDKMPENKGCYIFPINNLAKDDRTLYLTGGEEKAMLATKLGFRAITVWQGENGITPQCAQWIVEQGNKDVVLFLDGDAKGREFVCKVAQVLRNAGCETVKTVDWGTYRNDINDFCREFGEDRTKELLQTTIDANTVIVKKSGLKGIFLNDLIASDQYGNKEEWLFEGFIPKGTAMISAPSKTGKTRFTLQLAFSILSKSNCLGYPIVDSSDNDSVIYYQGEMQTWKFRQYCEDIARHFPNANLAHFEFVDTTEETVYLNDESFVQQIKQKIQDHKDMGLNPRLVVFDTYQRYIKQPKRKSNQFQDEVEQSKPIISMSHTEPNALFWFVHHTNKIKDDEKLNFGLINGSQAMRSAYDTNIILGREGRDEDNFILKIEGRSEFKVPDSGLKLSRKPIWNNKEEQK